MECPSCTEHIPSASRFCAFCGTSVRHCPSCRRTFATDASFCGACGTTLQTEFYAPSSEVSEVSEVVEDGELPGEDASWLANDRDGVYGFLYHPMFPEQRYFLFEGDTTIGAGDKNDIVVEKAAVSWNHALLVCRNQRLLLHDSASTNGTFLNEKRITRPRDIHHGDLVRFGNVEFRIWLKPQIRNQGK